ncbi:MAG: hypothetical protein Q7R73_00260 [bacterium]|nr:hypothetical protein [bacterium]
MSDMLNRLLRPPIRFFFDNIYLHIPLHLKTLWFFCKQYFIEGWNEIKENDKIKKDWSPLTEKLSTFTRADYNALLNFCTEDATSLQEAAYTRDVYCEFINLVTTLNLQKNVSLSIKMSQFGCFAPDGLLDAFGRDTATYVVRYARQRNIAVVFDGERLQHAPAVKTFVRELAQRYPNIAIRLQGYDPHFIEETTRFVETNIKMGIIIPISVCKGAYDEPDGLSAKETEVHIRWAAQYCRRVDYPIEVDTNDGELIRTARSISVGMLYGIKPALAKQLKQEGYRVHIYFPVITKTQNDEQNPRWEKFAIRRLVERPLYLLYPFKSLLDRLLGRNSYFGHKNKRKNKGCTFRS